MERLSQSGGSQHPLAGGGGGSREPSVHVALAQQRSVRTPLRQEELEEEGLDEQQLLQQQHAHNLASLTHRLAPEAMPDDLDGDCIDHEHLLLDEHEQEQERIMMMEEEHKEGQQLEEAAASGAGTAAGAGDAVQAAANAAKKNTLHKMRYKRRSQKAPTVKPWLCILPNGQTSTIQSDRYKLTTQLGIQMRDLRLLDPQMQSASPSAILCRDKAIVVNLEYVKAIITMDRVLVLNHQDPSVALFVENLQARIANPTIAAGRAFSSTPELQHLVAEAEQGGGGNHNGAASKPGHKSFHFPTLGSRTACASSSGGGGPGGGADARVGSRPGLAGGGLGAMSAQLPFELRVLEICLDEISNFFELLVTELEGAVSPVLESLTTKVTSPVLERLRRLKNRLVRLTTRVETIKEVLEKFLDDDEDMHDLNLTANHIADHPEDYQQQQQHTGRFGGLGPRPDSRPGGDDMAWRQGMVGPGGPAAPWVPSSGEPGKQLGQGGGSLFGRVETPTPTPLLPSILSKRSMASSMSTDSSVMESEVAVVEMLLESYFIKLDHYFNKLQNLSEEIKDAEELVNIKLDQHRNQLISTDLILTALTGAMAMVTTISGIFGMNLDSGLQQDPDVFQQVAIVSCVGAFLLFCIFVLWAWRYGLLVFS